MGTPMWLWSMIDHETGEIVAFIIGSRKHEMLEQLWTIITELNIEIEIVYADNNFAYHKVIPPNLLVIGKKNTQKIERKHLTFRTRLKRLARKTICYSKSPVMHKIMVSLLINVLEFCVNYFQT